MRAKTSKGVQSKTAENHCSFRPLQLQPNLRPISGPSTIGPTMYEACSSCLFFPACPDHVLQPKNRIQLTFQVCSFLQSFFQASSRPRLVFLLPYTLSSFCSPICFSVNYRFSLSPSPRLYGSLCLQHHAAIMTSMPSSSWRPREAPPLAIKGTTWIWKEGADHFGLTKEGDYFSLESWQETVEKKAEESKSKEGSFRREQRAMKKKI